MTESVDSKTEEHVEAKVLTPLLAKVTRRSLVAALVAAAVVVASIAAVLYFNSVRVPPAVVPVADVSGVQEAGTAAGSAPVSADPAGASFQKVQDFDDWALLCPTSSPSDITCFIRQQLVSASGSVVFAWSIQKDAKGVLHSVWQTPTGVMLTKGMLMDVGDGKAEGVPFSSCSGHFCNVRAVLAPDYLKKLEDAKSIQAVVASDPDGKAVPFPLSSRGLSAALSALAAR